jgi:hypothetical protein
MLASHTMRRKSAPALKLLLPLLDLGLARARLLHQRRAALSSTLQNDAFVALQPLCDLRLFLAQPLRRVSPRLHVPCMCHLCIST